jgi:integrase
MPRRGTRQRLEHGISRDATGYSVRVVVGSGAARRERERRFPPTLQVPDDLPFLRAQRAQLEADLRGELRDQDPDVDAARGTWAGDVRTYLTTMKPHLNPATYRSRVSELKAWTAEVGSRPRHHLRHADVARTIGRWRAAAVSAKTIRNRVRSFRHVYRMLDGKRARTPADEVELPKIVKRRPRAVDVQTVRTVIARLIKQERAGRLRDGKTRAWFLVRITTGQRPRQIMATTPRDVDLERRVWLVPPAKGGDSVPLYLNDDMLVGWTLFVASAAWGPFDTTSQARVLRRAGWPADIPIYNARHTVGMAFSESGEDLGDIQAWMGHRHIQTTRDFYVPGLFSRLKAMSLRADKRVALSPRWARFVGTLRKSRIHRRLRSTPTAS